MTPAKGRGIRGLAPSALFVAGLFADPAAAQNALQGKQLYQDIGRLRGAAVSCIDCHGGVPGALHGLGKAAGNPAAIEYAIGAIHQMTPLRGRVSAEDMADIAAYVGFPGVPSPEPRLSTSGEAASPFSAERLEFAETVAGSSSARSSVRLTNAGAVPLRLTSAPMLSGPAVSDFSLASTDCIAGAVLESQQSCVVEIVFHPQDGAPGLRAASVGLTHDWIRGGVNVALIGRVAGKASMP